MKAIYEIRNLANGKVYIGSAKNVSRRFIEHKRDLNRRDHANCHLQAAWNKYGIDAFAFSIMEEVERQEDLIRREQHWIDKCNAVADGYNIAPKAGSILGMKFSEETRQRMSLAKLGRKNSPEHVEKTRVALTGREMTDEQKQKMRDAKLGKKRSPHSDETKAKMSEASKGRKKSQEHRANLSKAKIGKKQSPEMVAKRMATMKRNWLIKRLLKALKSKTQAA